MKKYTITLVFFLLFGCSFPEKFEVQGEMKFVFQNDDLIEEERAVRGDWVVQQGKEARAKFNLFMSCPQIMFT